MTSTVENNDSSRETAIASSAVNYGGGGAEMRTKFKGPSILCRHTMLLAVVVVAMVLFSSSRVTNAEPSSPAQVAAAVAAATGTGEAPAGLPETSSPTSTAAAAATSTAGPSSSPSSYPTTTATPTTATPTTATPTTETQSSEAPDTAATKQVNDGNNVQQQDDEQRQQQLLLAPLLMPSASLSPTWPSLPQPTDSLSMLPSQAYMIGRERTVVEIVPVPSSSEQHLIDSPLDQSQPQYNFQSAENQQSEPELQLPGIEQPSEFKQSEPLEQQQQQAQVQQQVQVQQQAEVQQQTQVQQQAQVQQQVQVQQQAQVQQQPQQQAQPPTSDQQQYATSYNNVATNNNVPANNNNVAVSDNNSDEDQQQQYSYHYYYQQNLVQQQQLQQQLQQQHIQQQQMQQLNNNVAPSVVYSPYGAGQLYYYNGHFGGVGKYHPQQQLLQKHNYGFRARDGGRNTRRNTRSQQLSQPQPGAAHDGGGNGFYHHPAAAVQLQLQHQQQQQQQQQLQLQLQHQQQHQQQLLHQQQKPSSDYNGGDGDNVIGMKYDVQDPPTAGKLHQQSPSPPFRPSHPMWASQYPVPWTYYVKTSIVQPPRVPSPHVQQYVGPHNRKSRYVWQAGGAASNRIGGGFPSPAAKPPRAKIVYIEYGGFKPKMVPSVQITADEGFESGNRRHSTAVDSDETAATVVVTAADGSHNDDIAATPATETATTAASGVTTSSTSQPQEQPEPERQPPAAGVVVVVV